MNKIEKADYIFKRSLNGYEDFLQKTINLSEKIKETLFLGLGYRDGHYFMKFLQNNFSEKEIIELFESIDTNTIESNIVLNTIQIFKSLPLSLVYDKFRVKEINNNFSELHDEFSRLKAMEEDWLNAQPKAQRRSGLSDFPINNIDYVPNGII